MDIKLLITDLDGTFLNDQKEINPEFWSIYEQLRTKGITFVVATGRQLSTIVGQFEQIKNEVIFIAENGSIVKKGGKIIHIDALNRNDVNNFIEVARTIDGVNIVMCAEETAYIESTEENFLAKTKMYYHHLTVVDDLTKVDDTILKIALQDAKKTELNSYPILKKYEEDFRIAMSGSDWIDITTFSSTKGNAVGMIKQMLNINSSQLMVFGDYLNDYEMMLEGNHSFAMKNAHPKIKEIAKHITKNDNNNNGVIETLKEFLGI